MERLVSPGGAVIEARDEAVKNLLAMGFARVAEEKPKAAPKRSAKKKEK